MRLDKLTALLLAITGALSAARFSPEHAGRIIRLADPQISPDGKSIAVVVSRANFEENRYDPDLVLIDVATHFQRVLTHERRDLSQARWSPDGALLAFLAKVDGKAQIFVLPMNAGDSWQLTKSPTGVQQFAWRPGGRNEIAYVASDEPPKITGEERHNKSFEVQNMHFLLQEAPRPAHVWLISLEGKGTTRQLTSGEWSLPASLPPNSPASPLSWSPDGRQIALVKNITPYTGDSDKSSVQILDVETGELRALTGRSTLETQPVFSPDGVRVAHWYPRNGDPKNVTEIYVGRAVGGESTSITRQLDRNVQRAIWMPDGKSLLVSANDGTTVGLWLQPLDGSPRRIDLGNLVTTATFWLDACLGTKGELAFTAAEPQRPAELYYMASTGAAPQRLTDFNAETAALELGRSETIQWDNEGFHADGVVTYPPDFAPAKKYPLVLYIHGGPRSASKQSFTRLAQLLAAQGWIVFEPNYRGSDNLGNDFQAAIWNDAGAGPGHDVMTGVKQLEKRGFIDSDRMAVSGWSYGGYMTTWLLGNYPSRWKAAVAGAAVTDWMDQYNLGDGNVRAGVRFGGSPWTDAKRIQSFREQSPMNYAPKIKAPTLILSDTGDYRVPITQSFQLYHALRDNGVTTQFIAYPVSGHFPTDPVHSRDIDRRWIAWLAKYLSPERAASSVSR
jgi:dipeptidyl aminopeptidase/acylaminoacyl peptidase